LVSEYQADVNAAFNITNRYLSGESHSKEHMSGDDSADDGGRLAVLQDSQADADTQQETRGTYPS
jgi:putative transposase